MAAKELVNDMKLSAEVTAEGTYHDTFEPVFIRGTGGGWSQRRELWKKERPLGNGTFGNVWLERYRASETKTKFRAVKTIRKLKDTSHSHYLAQELEALAKFSQRKYTGLFVKSLGWFETEDSISIIMEHIKLGDLSAHLNGPLPEDEAQQISIQILRGLDHLHANNFVHRDLKPKNIFVMSSGPLWWIKIGDFGFSKRYGESFELRSEVGTALFQAPEIIGIFQAELGTDSKAQSHYTSAVDIWALGIITYYILSSTYLFPNPRSLWSYTRQKPHCFPPSHTQAIFYNLSSKAQGFLASLLAIDASSRLSAAEALGSAWLGCDSDPTPLGAGPESSLSLNKGPTAGSHEKGDSEENPIQSSTVSQEALKGWKDMDISSASIVGLEQPARSRQNIQVSSVQARSSTESFFMGAPSSVICETRKLESQITRKRPELQPRMKGVAGKEFQYAEKPEYSDLHSRSPLQMFENQDEEMANHMRFLELSSGQNSRRMSQDLRLEPRSGYNADMQSSVSLLGAAELGKSNILKEIKPIQEGGYSRAEREALKVIVHNSVLSSMRQLLEGIEVLEIGLEDSHNECHVQIILQQPHHIRGDRLPPGVGEGIERLWRDEGVQEGFRRSNEFQLNESAEYYFNAIERIDQPNYLPTDQDLRKLGCCFGIR